MDSLVIIGAGGHGKVAAEIAAAKYRNIVFLDDQDLKECAGYPVVGKTSDFKRFLGEYDFFIAIGNPSIRKQVTELLEKAETSIVSLIHPASVISKSAVIGIGSIVMAGAVLNAEAVTGKSCIINTCASVDHESILGDYVHAAVGAHITGKVRIGENTWIGAGAIVSNNVTICKDCMIGAGALVVKNIDISGTYVGAPAKKIK